MRIMKISYQSYDKILFENWEAHSDIPKEKRFNETDGRIGNQLDPVKEISIHF